ncbi:MAG: hypothetical protein ACI8XM_001599 [Haloarculaceae archaeon]|jgi:hypothetical protein
MLRGEFESAGESSPAQLRSAYDDRLVATVEDVGHSTVVTEANVEEVTVEALLDGQSPELSVETATAILATDPDRPDAETLRMEARDILLMGMSMAVLDVEAIASGIDDQLEPKEIQQKVEGRHPMTLDEYALLHSYIEGEKR